MPSSDESPKWDYVFNCAAETRLGQSDAVYNEGIYKLSLNCINEAINQRDICRYVEFSSANMMSSEHCAIQEDSSMKPWTKLAQHKEKIEKELEKRKRELNYTILRLPLVYGKGDRKGLSEFEYMCAKQRVKFHIKKKMFL